MKTCPNCGKVLSEDEKILYKCMSCKQQIELQYNNTSNTKNHLCKFLIGLFAIGATICLLIHIGTNKEYTIAKGDVALERVNSLQSNIWNLNPDVNTSELDKIVLKRNICIGTIVVSVIGIIICCIILFGKSEKTIYAQTVITNNSTQSKLKELEQIYKNNLITKEEYDNKRKEVLNKF